MNKLRYWWDRMCGNPQFVAVYRDGRRSSPLFYEEARSRVEIFGGHLVHLPTQITSPEYP